ncbi:UNVERIFIED_CONTAM: cupin domain-containing protein [Kocuria sp. CPCC 205316]|uniref:cupin domain-containing protein n=1 Tax=Kocuria TaxID=57493 RepID=UPI0036D919C9
MSIDPTAANALLVLQDDDRPLEGWHDDRGHLAWRTLFSAGATPSDALVTGVAELPEGGFLALHRHDQAETYYVLSGEGVVTLEGIDHSIRPGSNVFIPGGREHGARNTGAGVLRVFYVLAADDFADVEYVFS